jgi:hypothetical protein
LDLCIGEGSWWDEPVMKACGGQTLDWQWVAYQKKNVTPRGWIDVMGCPFVGVHPGGNAAGREWFGRVDMRSMSWVASMDAHAIGEAWCER